MAERSNERKRSRNLPGGDCVSRHKSHLRPRSWWGISGTAKLAGVGSRSSSPGQVAKDLCMFSTASRVTDSANRFEAAVMCPDSRRWYNSLAGWSERRRLCCAVSCSGRGGGGGSAKNLTPPGFCIVWLRGLAVVLARICWSSWPSSSDSSAFMRSFWAPKAVPIAHWKWVTVAIERQRYREQWFTHFTLIDWTFRRSSSSDIWTAGGFVGWTFGIAPKVSVLVDGRGFAGGYCLCSSRCFSRWFTNASCFLMWCISPINLAPPSGRFARPTILAVISYCSSLARILLISASESNPIGTASGDEGISSMLKSARLDVLGWILVDSVSSMLSDSSWISTEWRLWRPDPSDEVDYKRRERKVSDFRSNVMDTQTNLRRRPRSIYSFAQELRVSTAVK